MQHLFTVYVLDMNVIDSSSAPYVKQSGAPVFKKPIVPPGLVIHFYHCLHLYSNYAQSRKEVPFWGLHDNRKHLGGQIPQNRRNWALICSAERLSCASMKIDVIED